MRLPQCPQPFNPSRISLPGSHSPNGKTSSIDNRESVYRVWCLFRLILVPSADAPLGPLRRSKYLAVQTGGQKCEQSGAPSQFSTTLDTPDVRRSAALSSTIVYRHFPWSCIVIKPIARPRHHRRCLAGPARLSCRGEDTRPVFCSSTAHVRAASRGEPETARSDRHADVAPRSALMDVRCPPRGFSPRAACGAGGAPRAAIVFLPANSEPPPVRAATLLRDYIVKPSTSTGGRRSGQTSLRETWQVVNPNSIPRGIF